MKGDWQPRKVQPPRLFDPYYDWGRATRFAYYGRQTTWFSVLLELREPRVVEFAERVQAMRGQGWAELIRVPPLYSRRPKRMRKEPRFMSAFVRREFIERLYSGEEPSDHIARFQLGRSLSFRDEMSDRLTSRTGTTAKRAALMAKPAPGAVIIGVIDDDIAFAHERFRDGPASTRIHFFWDQLEPLGGVEEVYGREIFKIDTTVPGIDSRLVAYRHGALVDEDQLYRSYGYLDHSDVGHKAFTRRASHGTHVADLACNPPGPGVGPMIAVQLPSATVQDTSGGTLAPQVIDALWYMLHRADDIAATYGASYLPLVVNLSFGMLAGPHDGTGMLEQAIDEIIDSVNHNPNRPELRVVLPSGNAHLLRCHACFPLAAGAARTLHWHVLPDDWTESFLEIWYPNHDSKGPSALEITIASPGGAATLPFGAGTSYSWHPGGGVAAGLVSFYPATGGSSRRLVRLSLAPTAWPDGALTLAASGVWTVKVKNIGNGDLTAVDAWVQRDDTAYGYPRRGRQSYFVDPDYRRFDDGGRLVVEDPAGPSPGYVKRKGTLNAIATGRESVVVGGFRRSDWKAARYSSSGPVVHPPGRGAPNSDGPEAMAVCDDSPSHHGVLAAGSRSGSCVALHGTSVAAPQVTRWIAQDLLTGSGVGGRQELANYAVTPAAAPIHTEGNPPPGAAAQPHADIGGAGRIDLPSPRKERFDRR